MVNDRFGRSAEQSDTPPTSGTGEARLQIRYELTILHSSDF